MITTKDTPCDYISDEKRTSIITLLVGIERGVSATAEIKFLKFFMLIGIGKYLTIIIAASVIVSFVVLLALPPIAIDVDNAGIIHFLFACLVVRYIHDACRFAYE